MRKLDSLADEDWQILVDEYDINKPTICYPDRERRGCFVGPLAKVPVCATFENEDGDECLELDGADGRNLYAVACLPQFAELFRWIDSEYSKLGVSESDEYNAFVDSLKDRVDWIRACIDERDMQIGATGAGSIGFERWRAGSRRSGRR